MSVPIPFETGKAEFDEDGRRCAEDMMRQPPERIILSAHTDERGSDVCNLEPSRRRGEAVRRFLKERGVTRPSEVTAKGEREPFKLSDKERERYGQEKVWQMNRRVQWVR